MPNESSQTDWAKWATIVGMIVAVLTLIVATIDLAITYRSYALQISTRSAVSDVDKRVVQVQKLAAASQFVITSPPESGSVAFTDLLRGTTPYPNLRHYIVITPMSVGADWVQDDVAAVSGNIWSGRGRFGEADAGIGEKFLVRILATSSRIAPGQLHVVPPDGIFSQPTTVVRTR